MKKNGEKMNTCFLIGKIVSDIKFDFMIYSKYTSIVQFYIKDKRKNIIKIVGYDKIADYCYKNVKKNDIVFIEGRMKNIEDNTIIKIIEIKNDK
ncbi:MAG: hypothetical protein V8R81_02885 [Clostridia bacterium]